MNYGEDWKFIKNFISQKHIITNSAIVLSNKVKEELGLDLFPLIRTCAIKGYKYDGQMKFYMIGVGEYNYYYFDYPRKFYDKKNISLEIEETSFGKIITIKNETNERTTSKRTDRSRSDEIKRKSIFNN